MNLRTNLDAATTTLKSIPDGAVRESQHWCGKQMPLSQRQYPSPWGPAGRLAGFSAPGSTLWSLTTRPQHLLGFLEIVTTLIGLHHYLLVLFNSCELLIKTMTLGQATLMPLCHQALHPPLGPYLLILPPCKVLTQPNPLSFLSPSLLWWLFCSFYYTSEYIHNHSLSWNLTPFIRSRIWSWSDIKNKLILIAQTCPHGLCYIQPFTTFTSRQHHVWFQSHRWNMIDYITCTARVRISWGLGAVFSDFHWSWCWPAPLYS